MTAIGAYAVSPAFADGMLHEISGLIVFVDGFRHAARRLGSAEMETMSARSYLVVIPLLAALIAYTYALRYRDIEARRRRRSIPFRTRSAPSRGHERRRRTRRRSSSSAPTPPCSARTGAIPGSVVWLFIGYFGTQHENSQIHSPKHCYPGAGWNILDEGSTRIARRDEGDPDQEPHHLRWSQNASYPILVLERRRDRHERVRAQMEPDEELPSRRGRRRPRSCASRST